MSTDMGRKIRELREKCGLTQREVANAVGVTEATVSRWESGHINNMRRDKIQSLAKILQVSPLVIMGMKEQDPPAAPPSAQEAAEPYKAPLTERDERHGVKIPVLGRVVAGLPAYADQEIIGYDEITEERARTGEYFALIVRGDSMEPLFYEGDHVIIERQPDVDNGEIAIVGVDGDDATIKRIRKVDGGIILQPENRAYEPMFFSNKDIIERPVTIYGKVVEQRRTKF